MPVKYGDRYQLSLLPPSVEDYVPDDDVVRAYDAFVDHLNHDDLQFEIPLHMGRPKYDPKTMMKLLLYSYSYGIRSSRKIERACYHNLSFIWLSGGLTPDHKTIAEFRRKNKDLLKNVFKQCVRFCIKCDLIDGNILFLDGTKIRANASIKNTYTKEKCFKLLSKIDKRIEELLLECECVDQQESDQNSHIKLKKELANKEDLRTKVKKIMQELNDNKELKSKNTTDPDCSNMRSAQGTHAAHNVQQVVDDKNGLIVHVDTTGKGNDSQQFADQIDQANKMINKKCKVACADAGYASTECLRKIDDNQIKVIVPSQKQALHNKPKPFNRDEFTYNSKNDLYICPEGHKLTYRELNRRKKAKVYRIVDSKICRKCQHFGVCTRSKKGRKVARLVSEEVKQRLEKQYLEPSSQQIYQRRKEKVEHPFGHIKRNLKVDAFLLRGRDGTVAEMSLLATCFNVTRLISILGVTGLMAKKAI